MTNQRKILFGLMLTLIVGAFSFVYLRGQDRNWDLLNYHYYAGHALLEGRNVRDIAAAGFQSFLNPVANVISYLSFKNLPFPFGSWLILIVQLSSILIVILIAREIGESLDYKDVTPTEILAVCLGLVAPLWWSELGTSFFSSTTAPLILLGLYLLLREDSTGLFGKYGIVLAGSLFGLAAGLKLTNAPFAVAAACMLGYAFWSRGWQTSAQKLCIFVAGCIAGYGATASWNWLLWQTWGSPVFPLYNKIFRSPYWDLANVRDMRWYFSSIGDFLSFIVQAASGTAKASEVPFADVRMLIMAALLPAFILCKPAISLGRQAVGFLIFMLCSVALWALTLAYQRYLIPVELLFGLCIWLFVMRIVERERVRIFLMACLLAVSVYLVKIPDWGHGAVSFGTKSPFSLQMPETVSATPARYLVFGAPISYLLPSLHGDSVFFGVGVSRQVDRVIADQLQQPSSLQLRVIANERDVPRIPALLEQLSLKRAYAADCTHFKSGVGRYAVCQIGFASTGAP